MVHVEGGHALIVEDDPGIGFGVRSMLEGLGYNSFAFAASPQQAAEQCQGRRPDLATVDLRLLAGDGLEAARLIRGECGPVPVVFVTGSPELIDVRWAVVVEKPFTATALSQAVATAIRNVS